LFQTAAPKAKFSAFPTEAELINTNIPDDVTTLSGSLKYEYQGALTRHENNIHYEKNKEKF
jgi:hypothetical protein